MVSWPIGEGAASTCSAEDGVVSEATSDSLLLASWAVAVSRKLRGFGSVHFLQEDIPVCRVGRRGRGGAPFRLLGIRGVGLMDARESGFPLCPGCARKLGIAEQP